MTNNTLKFSGTISSKAVLENRPDQAIRLNVNRERRSKDIAYIISLAKRNKIPVVFFDKEDFNEQFEKGNGGIVLEASKPERPALSDFTEPKGPIYYLDGVEDPYNLGSCLRTLYASGASAVLLKKRDWKDSEATIVKASAGASEHLPLYEVESDDELIAWAADQKLPLVCAHRKDAVDLFDYTFKEDFCLVIGGALRGISAKLANACTDRVYIPYGRNCRVALDTASATAVLSFAWTRQHLSK